MFLVRFAHSSRTWRSNARLSSLIDSDALVTPSWTHGELRSIMRDLVAREIEPQAASFNRAERLNLPLLRSLGDLGLFGLQIPESEGGAGLDAAAVVIAHEELSTSDPGLCLSYLAHSLLLVNNFYDNASTLQKDMYLPDMLSGKLIGGMGMSESGSGTDVMSMRSKAVKDLKGWSLTGSKMWITNGCFDESTLGDIFLIYAKSESGLSLFLVPKNTLGFSLGQKIKDKCGMRSSATAELVFQNAKLPAEALIGYEGKGIVPMMKNLEIERIALAAMALGIARRSLEVMGTYSGQRKAFGEEISRFGQIQTHISESFAEYQAARSYVYRAASLVGKGEAGSRLDSDGVKLFATTAAKRICDRAMQVLGGNGYVGEYVVERLWRDSKLLEIGGGTLEAHQKNIAKDLTNILK